MKKLQDCTEIFLKLNVTQIQCKTKLYVRNNGRKCKDKFNVTGTIEARNEAFWKKK